MGIKGLGRYLKTKCPEACETVLSLEQFRGMRFVIDVGGYMHRFAHASAAPLDVFLKQYDMLTSFGIHVCYVFDGPRTAAKAETIEKRNELCRKRLKRAEKEMTELQEKLDSLDAKADAADLSPISVAAQKAVIQGEMLETQKKQRTVQPHLYTQLKAVFAQHNIPWIVGLLEAEKACAWLVQQGLADMVVSDDYDALACGAPCFLQHMQSSRYATRIVRAQPLLDKLKMTYEEFVDFCILCGSDFTSHIPKIGTDRAMKVIQKHKSIEHFLASDDWATHRKRYCTKEPQVLDQFIYKVARRLFKDQRNQTLALSEETLRNTPFEAIIDHVAALKEEEASEQQKTFESPPPSAASVKHAGSAGQKRLRTPSAIVL